MTGDRKDEVSSPPGESSPPPPNASTQPLPHQPRQPTPQPPSKPTAPATRKGRQRKQAESTNSHQQSSTSSKQPAQAALAPVPPHPSVSLYATPRGPILQPYPGPHFHIMNPPYPMNGSAYPQQQQHPVYPGQASPPMSATPPGMPPHPPAQYYQMHPQYPPGYPAYPQYGQPVVMYAPRPGAQEAQIPGVPPSPQTTSNKRKRPEKPKARQGEKASDDEASGSDAARPQTAAHASDSSKKRTKTQRACDSCRARKIRCDIIPDSEPQFCQHCKQYGFECTFFLPITETRFKKSKKNQEEDTIKEKNITTSAATIAPAAVAESSPAASQSADPSKRDIGIFGPTSAAHLLHSQASINSRIYENYDLRYHHTFEVSATGDGLIQVQKPTSEEQQVPHPKPVDLHIEQDIIEKLVNAYFTDVAPLLPVVTQVEFLATPNPPAILLYSMCLVSAARREVPQNVFDSVRFTVNAIIKQDDVLSTASIVNVQALLILCMTGDCHSQYVPTALSALWIRLGTAIRMAQDLGLHRAESVKQSITLRRRLWGACLISDRWTSLAYGHPYMIDVQDCDVRLPSSGDLDDDLYMDELVRLSVVLGRVLKAIYSPAGLTMVTDSMLSELFNAIETWKTSLPEHLKFRGTDSPQSAGLLHLLYACVCMMFWRVFMRISYSCPEHLKFSLTVEQWSDLVKLTGEAIDWLDAHERMYDIWLLVAYAATSCALVQYHTWVRRKDGEAATKLRKLRDCVRRWEGSISPEHMSARRKAAEIIILLYEATQGPQLPIEAPALNPTGGVKSKPPAPDLDYKQDPTRPGGGVFVVHGKGRERDYKDLPAGLVISSSSSDEASEGETSTKAVSSSVSGVAATNDSDPASFFSSSPFGPPLPPDRIAHLTNQFNTARTRPQNPQPRLSGPFSTGSNSTSTNAPFATSASMPVVSAQLQAPQSSSPLVKFTPLSPQRDANVNPALNGLDVSSGQVQLINTLDGTQGLAGLQELAMMDSGLLEGIPGSMFDWGQWDTYFARFNPQADPSTAAITAAAQLSALQPPGR
ncbi:hypothetical protein BDN72DRAFT_776954 [Pluteus cervinus]|uniref:Uncharacterized protein n=1 Tax=Pluteus cervinus TaxID=181527 RepID=A0ACD3AA91_9AGAR|nr:hypothetical protein BDN72DRAFT_776954 [Pluteus cervinus]